MRKRQLQLGINKAKSALRKCLLVTQRLNRELAKTRSYIWLNPNNYVGTRRLLQQLLLLAMAGLILFSSISPLVDIYVTHKYYALNSATSGLVGSVTDTLAKQITYDSTKNAYVFNASGMTPSTQTVGPDKVPLALLQAKVAGNNSKSKSTYSVVMPTDPKAGISYYDSNTGLSFQLVPNFTEMSAQQVNNHIVYPTSGNTQLVYSVKNNGLKEDIVLKQYVSDSLSFSYSLKLPQTLEARLLTDGSGSLGIYSADPSLFNNATTGPDYDPAKIASAQLHAQKDHLVFAIPAPVIKQTGKDRQGSANAYFRLSQDGQTLTVSANNLRGLHYPITVDPTVVITSTSDFYTGNNEDNNITYPANQINRGSLTGGSLSGGWTGTTALPAATYVATSVVYNGYIYEIGGDNPSLTSTVLYAPINSNGTMGSWTATTSLPTAIDSATSVAYNGYIYEIGGCNPSCATTAVLYAPINANGTIGAWTATTSLPSGVRFSTSVVYNGYLYEIGGYIGGATAIVDYAPINANGTIGAWTATTSLPAATYDASSVVYNGYVYILGGYTAGGLTTVDYAPINANGTLGSWTATTALSAATYNATSVVYNGYLYEIGGWNGTTYSATVSYAPINANGTIGAWTSTTALPATTDWATSVAYNGYVYEVGGYNGTSIVNTVSYAKIDPAGTTTAYSANTALPSATSYSTSVVYNGYVYEIGGYLTANVYYAPLNANGTIGAWTATTVLPTATYDATSVTYNGYLYLIGGYNSTSATVVVDYAPINANGTIGAWTATTSLPASTTSYNAASVVYNGYVYEIGGNLTSVVSYAPINSNGTIGSWASTTALPASTASPTSVTFNGYIYVMGGNTGAATANTYYASINSNGTIGSWAAATALPSATQYATSVVYNGYVYVIGGWNGTTYFSTVNYAPLNSNGTIGAWVANTSLPATTTYATSVVYNGYVYEIGGYNGTANVTTVNYAFINNGGPGTAGSWSATTVLPAATYYATSVAYNGFVYEIGGFTSSATTTVDYASINSNGTIGAWTATTSLPVATYVANSVAYNGYLYEIGGIAGSATTTVDYASINSNGTIGAWTATTSLPVATYEATSVAYNGYLYEIGGWNGVSNFANVYYAPLNANGTIGTWTATTSLPVAARAATSVVYNGFVYEIGSYTTSATATVYYAPLNANGTIGTWTATTSLPAATYYANTVAYNGYLYEIGGIANPTAVNYASINANGTIGTWTATTPLLAATQSATSVTYNGYMYVIGGNTTTAVSYAPLNVMPRVGHYSQMFNFGSAGITPFSITYNGNLPKANGLSPIQYKTATSSAVLGASQYSTVLNGTSTDCNSVGTIQYVSVTITLDDSSSAAFPDVNTTPANVTDFTITYNTYHPSPNLRLRGGKYFNSNGLQALDTCSLIIVPNSPTIGTATYSGLGQPYNNGTASVSFTPSSSGYAATYYTVTASSGGYSGTGTSSPITVNGLQSGVSYTFTVTASNAFGTSNPISSSNSITVTTMPQTPSAIMATDTGSGRAYNNGLATISFTAGGTGGLSTTYVATASAGGYAGSGSSPISVAGLQSGTNYSFIISATNANGTVTSASSNTITATTVPQAPTIGTATATGNHTASVGFTPNGNGGLGVTYTASPGSGSGASPISVSGLSVATSYSFTVTATNSNGSSTSATSNTITTTGAIVTGGTLTSDATYYYRTFLASGTLGVTGSLTSDLLIIAGGGGGGSFPGSNLSGGGGGAGGVNYLAGQSLSANQTVTVGAGGAPNNSGNDSSVGGLTAIHGGGGNGSISGGSGGGGVNAGPGGSGTAGQGYTGGSSSGNGDAGGGGGAGGVGRNAFGGGGTGGVGTSAYASWASATGTGVGGYYAGGGGGGFYGSGASSGGAGGGGSGSCLTPLTNSTAGIANTGGGGGGGDNGNDQYGSGKAGGSGIVIIRYLKTATD